MRVRRRMPRLGTRKLYHLLQDDLRRLGIKIGRDRLFDWLREHRLLVQPRKNYTKTTHSKHWMRKHPNLLAGHKPSRPEQVFVSDITYVESDEGVHYLSLVTDAFSRKIMGHCAQPQHGRIRGCRSLEASNQKPDHQTAIDPSF